MDPDPAAAKDGNQIVVQLFKTTVITVAFISCYKHNREDNPSLANIHFTLPDSVATEKKTVLLKKKKRTIYLTFDDGPNKGTRKVMQIARQEQMPITMFLIGEQVYGSKEQTATYDSILQCNYVQIANHSYTHAHHQYEKFYAVPDSAVKDFIRCADSLKLTYNIVRTPGRNIWRTDAISSTDLKSSRAAADSLQKNGMTVIGWDLEWHYDKDLKLKNTGDEMINQVDSMFVKEQTKTPNELVILAHDQVYADASDSAELHSFMQKLKNKDEYNFDVISNYPSIKN
ncbi:MAG: polysaccharide deacetylase family protein [Bacteroidota bacterium]